MDLSLFYGNKYDNRLNIRAEKLISAFETATGLKAAYLFSSPGRAEVLGNHTDHNHGKVMVAAINCDILCCVTPTSDNVVTVYSEGYKPIITTIDDTETDKKNYGTSLALVKGVISKLKEFGYKLGGFTAYATSDIFKGAGVSSSAAFEVLICEIFNELYLGNRLDAINKAIISQYSENVYFGKPCGLLDQSGIAIGSLCKLDFKTPEKPQTEKITPPDGYTFVITNTGGDHAKLTDHYAAIRSEMESIAGYFNKKVLREVDYRQFFDALPELKKNFSSRAILRALHFYNENERVDRAFSALKKGDAHDFLQEVAASGESSLSVLQNCYVPASVDQPVVLAIEIGKAIIKDGACRVHGGGFAGSVLAIVNDEETENYVGEMKRLFGNDSVFTAYVRNTGTCGFKL